MKTSEKDSFSDVVSKYYPKKRKLFELLAESGTSFELADAIEKASRDLRAAKMKKIDLES